MSEKKCCVKSCDNEKLTDSYCSTHYQRVKKTGSPFKYCAFCYNKIPEKSSNWKFCSKQCRIDYHKDKIEYLSISISGNSTNLYFSNLDAEDVGFLKDIRSDSKEKVLNDCIEKPEAYMKNCLKGQTIVVSGGFDPLHSGHLKMIVEELEDVDEVVLTGHEKNPTDLSIVDELEEIMPDIFANGGDRKDYNIPEYSFCDENKIMMVFNVGGEKKESSSELVRQAAEKISK